MRLLRSLLPLTIVACLHASSAHSTPTYPDALRRELSLSFQPNCSLCHLNGVTGLGTVNTPFGTSMRASGLVPHNEASLAAALADVRAKKVDSDLDGAPDIEELASSNNPNGTGKILPGPFDPKYGCGANTTGGAEGILGLAALAAVTLWARRRTA